MVRRLAAILAADVVGYSRLMEVDEAETLAALKRHRSELIDPLIAQHGGRIVKLMGDGALVEFPSVVDAVNCSIDVQRGMEQRNEDTPQDRRIVFRIGVNLGDIIVDGEDIYGDGVNVASRVETLSEPGGIALSSYAHDQVVGKVEIGFDDAGEHELKNMARPVRVYRAVLGAEPTTVAATGMPLALPDKPSIAVLPFTNMSGDQEQEYFSDGITEDIITELSRFRNLFVIARNSSFSFKGQAIDIKDVGRKLGVAFVLEGSVRKAGQRVRITAQLIEAATGNHIWAERYDRDLEDIFVVQDEVVSAIVTSLEPQLGSFERQRARRKPADNLDAWESLQRGLWHLYGSMGQGEEVNQAVSFMQRAINLDPEFSEAYAGLALALYYRWLFRRSADPEDDKQRALAASRKAISLDPEDAFAHTAQNRVHIILGDQEAAIADAEAAIALNPSYAHAYFGHAHALWHAGRPEEALTSHDMAIRLSPRDPLMWAFLASKSIALSLSGRPQEALDLARKSQRQPGATLFTHVAELLALGSLGATDEAVDALDRARKIEPEISVALLEDALPISEPAVRERFVAALRQAGVPK